MSDNDQPQQQDAPSSSSHASAPPPAPTLAPPQATAEDNNDNDAHVEVEQLRLHLREVFVYAVPRLVSAKGYRAEDLDLPNPILTGYLKAYQKGDHELFLRIFTPEHVLFAECPISLAAGKKKPLDSYFIPVVDSSRYFVIKVVDKGRHAFIAIGFRERSDAFDLKALLEDLVAYNQRVELANTRTQQMDHLVEEQQRKRKESNASDSSSGGGGGGGETAEEAADVVLSPAMLHLRLKDGEKIKLDLTHALERGGHYLHHHSPSDGGEKERGSSSSSPAAVSGDVPVLLPPPPSDGGPRKQSAVSSSSSSSPDPPPPALGEDEWGSFVG